MRHDPDPAYAQRLNRTIGEDVSGLRRNQRPSGHESAKVLGKRQVNRTSLGKAVRAVTATRPKKPKSKDYPTSSTLG